MLGYVLHGINDLRFEEIDYPICTAGWCIVKVKYVGICSSDIPRIFKKGTYTFPTIPGHEFSGVIDSVADKENDYLVGRNVSVFPLIPCRKCNSCMQGHYEMCENYDYIGSRRNGAFAEYVAVPVWNVVELPQTISFKDSAMMEPLAVALHAIRKANINKGESVCIIGSGMIAFAAAQWAVMLGAVNVTVLGRSIEKKKIADQIPYVSYKILSEINYEFDVVLEAVGSNESIQKSIELVRAGGSLVLMGNPEGEIDLPQNVYWRILRKQLKIYGTWNSSYEKNQRCDWIDVCDALEKNEIKASLLITHIFDKSKLLDGLELMRSHQEPYCKVLIKWS